MGEHFGEDCVQVAAGLFAQEFLGHSSSRVTLDIYTHLMKDSQKNAAQKLGSAIFIEPVAIEPGAVN